MNHRFTRSRRIAVLGNLLAVLCLGWSNTWSLAQSPGSSSSKGEAAAKKRTLGIVLYPNFEILDVYGPVEMFANVGSKLKVVMVAETAGPVQSTQGPKVVADYGFDNCPDLDLVLVPGGRGTLKELGNAKMMDWLRQRADKAEIVMSVCTGSALLAKAGLLDGRPATSNKQHFSFVAGQGPKVKWVKQARWVDDGNRVTASGVSAGIDMALHVIARLYGESLALKLADGTEYQWHRDANVDPFAKFAK
jgi:transcriptional regulator GlxA family with amidase domain